MGVGVGEVEPNFQVYAEPIFDNIELDAAQLEVGHTSEATTPSELLDSSDDETRKKNRLAQVDLEQPMAFTHGDGQTREGSPSQCPALAGLPPHVAALMVKASILGAALPAKPDMPKQQPIFKTTETEAPRNTPTPKQKIEVDKQIVVESAYSLGSPAVHDVHASMQQTFQYEEKLAFDNKDNSSVAPTVPDRLIKPHIEQATIVAKPNVVQLLKIPRIKKNIALEFGIDEPTSAAAVAVKKSPPIIAQTFMRTAQKAPEAVVRTKMPKQLPVETEATTQQPRIETNVVADISSNEGLIEPPKHKTIEQIVTAAIQSFETRISLLVECVEVPRKVVDDVEIDVFMHSLEITDQSPVLADHDDQNQAPQPVVLGTGDIIQKIIPATETSTELIDKTENFVKILPVAVQEQFGRVVAEAEPEKAKVIGQLTTNALAIADTLRNLYETDLGDTNLALSVEIDLKKVYVSLMRELNISVDERAATAFVASIVGDTYIRAKQTAKPVSDPMRERQVWRQTQNPRDALSGTFISNVAWLVKIMVGRSTTIS